jgi:hypothetical protein
MRRDASLMVLVPFRWRDHGRAAGGKGRALSAAARGAATSCRHCGQGDQVRRGCEPRVDRTPREGRGAAGTPEQPRRIARTFDGRVFAWAAVRLCSAVSAIRGPAHHGPGFYRTRSNRRLPSRHPHPVPLRAPSRRTPGKQPRCTRAPIPTREPLRRDVSARRRGYREIVGRIPDGPRARTYRTLFGSAGQPTPRPGCPGPFRLARELLLSCVEYP